MSGFTRGHDETRVLFIRQIESACRDLGIALTWCSEKWIGIMTRGAFRQCLIGYTFDLNHSAAVELAVDKAATSMMLATARIASILHREFLFGERDEISAAADIVSCVPLPVVLKPVRGHSGADVLRAQSMSDLIKALSSLRARHRSIAVSPLIKDAAEYRVVVLDGQVLLTFRKVLAASAGQVVQEWRHNAEFGSKAEIVTELDLIHPLLGALALRAMEVLGLRVGAVDILQDGGNLLVLEVNDAFSLNRFSLQSNKTYEWGQEVYHQMLLACFAP